MSRILIAEGDRAVASFMEKGLRASGWSTHTVHDAGDAEYFGLTEEFDLMILDMGLPHDEGMQVLRAIRSRGRILPVLALSAATQVTDVVACLDEGADDYMRRPLRIDELLARVRARLRPAGTDQSRRLSCGDLTLDLRTRRAGVGGRPVELSHREYALLETLLRHVGQVLTRDQLRIQSWGNGERGDNLVNVYVSALRRKVGEERIETVHGVGYRLRQAVALEPVALEPVAV